MPPLTSAPPAVPGAVVLGSDYRALALVRSLGRRGIPVWVLAGGDDRLAAVSRYAMNTVELPDGDEPVRDLLLELSERRGLAGWVLFPTSDEAATLVADAHEHLAGCYALTSPPWGTLRWARDKLLSYQLAESLGLGYPRTWTAATAAEAAELDVPFPVIIKPSVKTGLNALTAAKAWRVDDRDQLARRFGEAAALVDPSHLMVQELIPGRGADQLSYAALCEHGRPLAGLTARRSRQYPADFGRASTFVETVVAADVEEAARAFLAEARFDGLVEVEFMRDPRDGVLRLLDVNPRVWGWHGLCPPAGVDFPYLAFLHALGKPLPRVQARAGVRWLRWTTDLPTSAREIVRGNLGLRPYLGTLMRRHESATFAWDDLRPALSELPMLARTLIRRKRDAGIV